jgi:hypothetical protein
VSSFGRNDDSDGAKRDMHRQQQRQQRLCVVVIES